MSLSPGTATKTCEKHGEYEARNIGNPGGETLYSQCPKCMEERQKRYEEEERREAERQRQWRISSYLTQSGIPKRYKDKTLDDLQFTTSHQIKNLRTVKNYLKALVNETSASLILCGKPGTGKTHIGTALVSAAICDAIIESQYISIGQILRKVKSTYNRNSEQTEDQIYYHFGVLPFLVIDEVGVQFGTDSEKMIFFEVINRRYENMLPTVLISNLTVEELTGFIGERVMDRFKEDQGAVLAFDWDSYRGK